MVVHALHEMHALHAMHAVHALHAVHVMRVREKLLGALCGLHFFCYLCANYAHMCAQKGA